MKNESNFIEDPLYLRGASNNYTPSCCKSFSFATLRSEHRYPDSFTCDKEIM